MVNLKYKVGFYDEEDGIIYKSIETEEEFNLATEFFWVHYLPDEPLTKAGGGYGNERPAIIEKEFKETLREGVSLMAMEKKSKKFVGFRISGIKERKDIDQDRKKPSLEELKAKYPYPECAMFYCMFSHIDIPGMFDTDPNLNRLFWFFMLGTHPDVRGQGIGKKLLCRAQKVAKSLGCERILGSASHPHSHKAFVSTNMELKRVLKNTDIIYEGKPYTDDPNIFVSTFEMDLTK